MKSTRKTLLSRIRRRDDDAAWSEFAALYRAIFRNYGRACGLTAGQAETLAETCMTGVAAHVRGPAYDADRRAFKSWLSAYAREQVRRAQCRAGSGEHSPADVAPPPRPGSAAGYEAQRDDVFDRIWTEEHLHHCLDQLRIETEFKTFEAFRRLAVDGWTVERVCDTYSLTSEYVHAIKARLSARLRWLMAGLIGE